MDELPSTDSAPVAIAKAARANRAGAFRLCHESNEDALKLPGQSIQEHK
jgi:hypothetical protein